jgi:hypothetical protein
VRSIDPALAKFRATITTSASSASIDGVQTVLFRSRSGNPVRNAQYNEGLELLLSRLGSLGATLTAAVVDSADTRRTGMTGAADGTSHSFIDCYLCTVNEPYYYDGAPFWPDEIKSGASKYPHRVGIDPAAIGSLSLADGFDLSADVIDAARRSHLLGAQGFMADATGSPRLAFRSPFTAPPSASDTQPEQGTTGEIATPTGQGRSVDPIRRRRVEDYAMNLARKRYESDGWVVKDVSRRNDEEKGTPYDFHCTRGTEVRHVEVKGTTGSGETVLVSANERSHAEAAEVGAYSYLFVVEQVGLKTVKGNVVAVGGSVRYDGPFDPSSHRFTPTQFRYILPKPMTAAVQPARATASGVS